MQGVRRLFLGGNWKSNNLLADSKKLAELYNKHTSDKVDVVAFPIDGHLSSVRSVLRADLHLGSQDVSYNKFGAFTGETTAEQLLDLGARWALIGHSERRTLFGDSTPVTFKKLKRAMEAQLGVVFCVGETLAEREGGITNKVLSEQLEGLKGRIDVMAENTSNWNQLVLAYEPVWAIGTGKVATPEQAEETHKFIRSFIESKVSPQVAASLRIIYGGSVKGENAPSLVSKPNIDGFLVGGASLTQDFLKIGSVLADHAGR